MENVAIKAHINQEGGTHSQSLMTEMGKLGLWVKGHVLSIRAEYISGIANVQADWLSRMTLDHSEWCLHLDLLNELRERFGHLIVDLFAHPWNTEVLLQVRNPGSRRGQCSPQSLATVSALRL